MPWSKITPRKLQRAIGENETFLKLIGDSGHPLDLEHWAINATASFQIKGSLLKEDLSSLLLKAWKNLRFNHPSIAAYAIDDTSLEYTVPDTPAVLSSWAAETFHVVEEKSVDEIIAELKPGSCATLTYLPKSNEILIHTAHWRTDGIGALLLIDALFEHVTNPHLPNPDMLSWGQELPRLTLAVEETADMPNAPTDDIKAVAQKYVETFHQVPGATGIPYKGQVTTPPGSTRSFHLTFSPSDTTTVISQCKAGGFSITSAVHASIGASNYALASAKDKNKHYTSTVRFSLRPYLPKPNSPAYASGLYTSGWMHTVPASASWKDNAKAYNDIYRKGVSKEFITSHRQYALDLGNLIRNTPQDGGDPPSDVDISSIGVAENYVSRAKGTIERGLEVNAISVGVEMLTRQCVCFVWTFQDQLNFNLVYNENFHDEKDAALFLETLKRILLEELAV